MASETIVRGRRTKFNLRREGYEDCAEFIVKSINRVNGCHRVYIDWRGDIRVLHDANTRQPARPDSELLGRYRKGVLVEQIEDDLIPWQREQSK